MNDDRHVSEPCDRCGEPHDEPLCDTEARATTTMREYATTVLEGDD